MSWPSCCARSRSCGWRANRVRARPRLLAEMADRLTAERGSVVIYAACPRLLGSGTRLMASLAAAVRPRAGPADTTSDDLSMLLDEPAAHDEPVHPDLDVRRTQLVSGVASMLTVAASEQQLILVIDDVHWLDDVAVTMLHDVVCRSLGHVRWVFAGRPLGHHPHVAWLRGELERTGGVRHVELGELTLDDVRELVGLLAPEDAPEMREDPGRRRDVLDGRSRAVRHRAGRPPPAPARRLRRSAVPRCHRRRVHRRTHERGACARRDARCGRCIVPRGRPRRSVGPRSGRCSRAGGATRGRRAAGARRVQRHRVAPRPHRSCRRSSDVTCGRAHAAEEVGLYSWRGTSASSSGTPTNCCAAATCSTTTSSSSANRAVADAIQRLLIQVESAAALFEELADRYLGSTAGTGPSVLEARLQAATVLIANRRRDRRSGHADAPDRRGPTERRPAPPRRRHPRRWSPDDRRM